MTYEGLVTKVVQTINGALVPLLGGAAVIFFFWGLVRFLRAAEDESARREGRLYMMWAGLGLLVMVGLWGFVGYLSNLLGIEVHIPQFEG